MGASFYWWWFYFFHIGFEFKDSMFICIVIMWDLLVVYTPLLLKKVRHFSVNSLYLKWKQFLFIIRRWHFCQNMQFSLVWMHSSQHVISLNNGNLVYLKCHLFYIGLYFLMSVSLLHASGFCCGLYLQHPNPHLKWHLQYQIHLVGLWRFCWSFARTCHLLVLLQMVSWWISTCQIDMQMWLHMMIWSGFMLWYHKHASIISSDCTFIGFQSILLIVGFLCTGLMTPWLSLMFHGSRHRMCCAIMIGYYDKVVSPFSHFIYS